MVVERSPSVSIVITTWNEDPRYLNEAIESARRQTRRAKEILVVDDGSNADIEPVLQPFPEVRLLRQSNQGLSSARNTGWRCASGSHVVFLDSDDRLLPEALASNLRLFADRPDCAFVYGAYRFIDGEGRFKRAGAFVDIGSDPYRTLLSGNSVGMHGAVMYRREPLETVGGFDPSCRACEDYELYLRLARQYPVVCAQMEIAEYREHERNMSNDDAMMLRTALQVLRSQRSHLNHQEQWENAYREGVREWKRFYATRALGRAAEALRAHRYSDLPLGSLLRVWAAAPLAIPSVSLRAVGHRLRARASHGRVDLGELRRTTPVSRNFGFDRGKPVDRRYIEAFLERHATDIRGRVLEIGDNTYTTKYGGDRVTKSEVLHRDEAAAGVTYVADLTRGDVLPSNAFDCIILTQTLHLIFDLREAVGTLHRVLRPGGVLLATVPGVSSVDRGEWGRTWYWSLTALAMARLLEEQFEEKNVRTISFGNVLTAVAFLHGLAEDELEEHEVAASEPQYPVIVAARAVK